MLNGEEYTLNTFSLTFPDGQVFTHSKDIPTIFEHFSYTYGDENNVLENTNWKYWSCFMLGTNKI